MAQKTASTHAQFDFFLLPTRAWELGFGAIIAIIPNDKIKFPLLFSQIISFFGLFLVIYSFFVFDRDMPLPSLYSLFPVGGAAIVILFATGDTLCGRILSIRPIVSLGLVSYSAYLWHQPLFAFARIRLASTPTQDVMLILSAASVGLAYLSWFYVERPFRIRGHFSKGFVYANSVLVAIVLTSFGIAGYLGGGFPSRLPADAITASNRASETVPRAEECFGEVESFISPDKSCTYPPPLKCDRCDMGR